MLDETLVMCISEHGRTPQISNASGGGRDHWSQAYTCMFAGGGVARGRVVGKTDKHGGTRDGTACVAEGHPGDDLSPAGHRPGDDVHDRTGRPYPLVASSQVVQDMLA